RTGAKSNRATIPFTYGTEKAGRNELWTSRHTVRRSSRRPCCRSTAMRSAYAYCSCSMDPRKERRDLSKSRLSPWTRRDPDRVLRAFSSEVDTGSHSNQVYADCVDLSAQKTRQNKNLELRF